MVKIKGFFSCSTATQLVDHCPLGKPPPQGVPSDRSNSNRLEWKKKGAALGQTYQELAAGQTKWKRYKKQTQELRRLCGFHSFCIHRVQHPLLRQPLTNNAFTLEQ